MKTKNVFKLISIFLLVLFFVISCKKEKIEDAQEASTDEEVAQSVFDDAFTQSDNALAMKTNPTTKSTQTSFLDTTGVIITVTPSDTTYPKDIVLDFGTGATDSKGNVRKGKILINVTGKYRTIGAVRTIKFDNYYINDYKVDGIKTVTNKGRNSSGFMFYNIDVKSAVVTTPEGGEILWESTRVRTWVNGEDTKWFIWDDEYDITGTSSGTGINGNKFSATIIDPLKFKLTCRYIVQGTIDIVVGDNPAMNINYGSGECDDKATLTYKNKTKEISLRKRAK